MGANRFVNFFWVLGTVLILNQETDGEMKRVKCLENGRFYRDPERAAHKMWTQDECSRYFLCLEGEVFDFRCSADLLFDVNRQICDFKLNVDNCDLTAEGADCPEEYLGCADGTCLPQEYFCDGTSDCQDGSDEGECNPLTDPIGATPCDPQTCLLPDCFCSGDGTAVPGNLHPSMVPQMVLLTFDDAVNEENWDLYSKILFPKTHQNPNGCSIRATFFISHQYNNYHYSQKLWNDGHEIAIHSITHRGPEEWWAFNATIEDWFDEMVGQANILNRFSKVRLDQIRGMRVPFLRPGWNKQFLMMKEFGFVYDSSIVAPFGNPPVWPYTLDHRIPHDCTGAKQLCPTRSYNGVWELPVNQLQAGGFTCTMVDSCPPDMTGSEVYAMLMHNFRRHYMSNRAPLGLHFHSTWFKEPEYLTAFQNFLSDIMKEQDVWFVTGWQAIEWMKRPTTVDQLHSFTPWSCYRRFEQSELACSLPNVCKLHSRVFQEDRLLQTCAACPQKYPWIRNEFGLE